MTNEEHLAILKQGVKVWNKWREENSTVRPDLIRADLNGAKLRAADLHEANLRVADLSGANLHRANLYGADLRRTDLSEADLSEAKLWDTRLHEANLRVADLSGANLHRANLYGADLNRAILRAADLHRATCGETLFSGVDLSEVKGLETIVHYGRSYIDIHTLYSSKGKIPEVFLRGCGIPEEFITFLPALTGKAIEFYSCFISYSHADKAFARRLYDTLQGQGIRCWLDEKEITPGLAIAAEIDRGIKYWDKTILCCSKSAMTEKWWVAFEMKKALAKEQDLMRERGQDVRVIIPLDLDGYLLGDYAGEYRSEIMSRSVANFKGWQRSKKTWDREIERVIAALRTDEGRSIPPKPKL